MKVLCLHGYTQNAIQFRGQTHALRKAIKAYGELEYHQAPFALSMEESKENDKCTWWKVSEDVSEYVGVDQSIRSIKTFVESNGPFDVLFGFSQGACIAALCCSNYPKEVLGIQFEFKGLVVAGGFTPRAENLRNYFSPNALDIPSLHVIGEKDAIITKERSLQLSNCFINPCIAIHDGGHYVPANASFSHHYRNFLDVL